MKKSSILKITLLFILFFTFQWMAQFAAGKMALSGHKAYFILMYFGFFSRAMVWVEILRDMRLISAYSISSLSYLLVPLLSWLLLAEPYKLSHLLGGGLILAGIIVFSLGEQKMEQLELEKA